MLLNLSLFDLKYYLRKNKKIYLFFLFFFFIGIVIGVFVSISSDSYLSLLTTKDKLFYDYVNGKIDFNKEVIKLIFNFVIFQLIIFLLNLNFYTGLLSYVLVSYQSALMVLSMVAIFSRYGIGGFFNIVVLMLPINLILLVSGILFAGFCLSRSLGARFNKKFSYGFDNKYFWLVVLFFILFDIVFSFLINLIFVMFLKRRFFIIF